MFRHADVVVVVVVVVVVLLAKCRQSPRATTQQ